VGVAALVQRAVDRARHGTAPSDLVHFDLDLLGGPTSVLGDADLLRHALVNVIDNALLAMPEGGTLSIRVAPGEIDGRSALVLIFADEGEGMDTLVRDKATAPFFTTRPAGTGLGLAIVERVIRNHGGRVEIESSYGAGTCVTIRLPLERPSLLPPPRGERRDSDLGAIRGVSP
jgi:signal transduction histidine kinase